MKIIRKLLLLGSIMASLFSDIIPGLTQVFVLMYLIVTSIYIIKNKKFININKYYILTLVIIISILISTINNFNTANLKFILYLVSLIFIMESTTEDDIKLVLNILTIVSILCGIYIIIIGKNFDATNLDFINVRSEIIIQKQTYNGFMNIILPYIILKIFIEKKKIYFIPLIINIISSIFVFQIKTLLITLPLAFLLIVIIKNKISFKKYFKYVTLLVLMIFIIYKLNIIQQLTPIIDYLLKGENSQYLNSKYLDTLLLRKEILLFALILLKDNLFFGIGYGNYGYFSSEKYYYVASKSQYVQFPNVTESGFLSFLVEGGIVGFICFIILFGNILYDIRFIIKKRTNVLNEAIIVAFLCLLISNIIQDNLNFSFWFIVGTVLSVIRNEKVYKYESINN